MKNWLKESYFEMIPQYQTNIPSRRKFVIQCSKFAVISGLFVWLFVFLFLKKGIWFTFIIASFFACRDLFIHFSFYTKEIQLKIGTKTIRDFSRKFHFNATQKKYSILLGLSKLFILCGICSFGLYRMSLPETQVKFLSEEELVLVLQEGDTLYARYDEVDVSIREAENTYIKTDKGRRRIRYNYFYSDAFTSHSKAIGIYYRLNFLGYQDSLSRKFFAIRSFEPEPLHYNPHYSNDSLFERVLDDSLLFVEPFQVTISPEHYQRLVNEGKKWDFKWF